MSIKKRTRTIGKMHFGPEVDITDPSYERDVWCRKNDVSIKEGEYFCMISEVVSERVINGEDLSYSTVAKMAINLAEEIPDECDTEYIGEIGVDAGLAGFFRNKPNTTSEEWGEFCSRIDYNEDVA